MKTLTQTETPAKITSPTPEVVGRKYEVVCFGVMSRRVGGDGRWYGSDFYKTEDEARSAFADALQAARYQVVGGIAVDFGPDTGERYERKLVRIVKHCEVLDVGIGPA